MYRIFTLIASIIILSACTSISDKDYYYNEIVLRNTTTSNVTNVVISTRKNGGVFSCSFIAPRGVCSSKFPAKKVLGNPVSIKWSVYNINKSVENIVIPVPPGADSTIPLRGMLDILGNGNIRPYLE